MLVLGYIIILVVILVAAIVATVSRSMVRAAIALGTGSVGLSIIFFMLNAPYAGGFELSVGAGLVSVLFIVAISLTEAREENSIDA